MVIVTTHAIVAFFLEQREPGRFLTSSESTSSVKTASSHDSEAGIKRIKQEKTQTEALTVSSVVVFSSEAHLMT